MSTDTTVAKKTQAAPKLRKSITPGTVLILLAGRFAGRRVVFLKQLPSGLLLVSGPFKLNGVPLRRVDQRYVIATSTKVDISALRLSDFEITDSLFQVEKTDAEKQPFFTKHDAEKKEVVRSLVPDSKKQLQATVDAAVIVAIKKQPFLSSYLRSRFSLKSGQAPHAMRF